MWKTRELVSHALSLLLTEQDCAEVLKEVYERMTLADQNSLHGLLSAVRRTLRDRGRLLLAVVEDETGGRRPISHLLLTLHLQKWWIGSR